MKKKPVVLSFWKVSPSAVTHDAALAKSSDLQRHAPKASWDDPFFKWCGWEFDIGRKPFLIETDGRIQRVWGRSADDVRDGLGLGRKTKIVADPFKRRSV